MAIVSTNFDIPPNTWVNLASLIGLPVGNEFSIENVGATDIFLATSATQPTDLSSYQLLARNVIMKNNEGDNFSWAFCMNATGRVNINGESFFTSTWDTTITGTSGVDQIALPLKSSGTYNFDVIYNGSVLKTVTLFSDNIVTFPDGAGVKTIKIVGDINEVSFNFSAEAAKITNISAWGQLKVSNGFVFRGCSNLTITATDILDISSNTAMLEFLSGCTSLTSVPSMNLWDFSNINRTDAMLSGASLFNSYMGDIDTQNVTTMRSMYRDPGGAIYNQPDSFNRENVVDLSGHMEGLINRNQVTTFHIPACKFMNNCFVTNSSQNKNITLTGTGLVEAWSQCFLGFSAWDGTATISIDDFSGTTTLVNFFTAGAMSTGNYDQFLEQWVNTISTATGLPMAGFNVNMGNSKFSAAGKVFRDILIGRTWTIADGGQA